MPRRRVGHRRRCAPRRRGRPGRSRPAPDKRRGKRGDGGPQRFEARDVLGQELGVVELLLDDHPDEAGEDRSVLPGSALEVVVGALGEFGLAGVDDDQRGAALFEVLDEGARVPVAALVAHHRVVTDDQRHVGIVDPEARGHPGTVEAFGEYLARLVHRVRRENHRGAERLHERVGHRHVDGVLEGVVGPPEEGDGPRSMQVPDRGDPLGDLVDGVLGGDADEFAVRCPLQ